MMGATDEEIAFMFGYSADTVKAWRKLYSDFDKAIEDGRTQADLQVLQALHQKAVGFEITKDVPIKVKRGKDHEEVEVHTITERHPPEFQSIKFWLSNRNPEHWNRAAKQLRVGGTKDGAPIDLGVKSETKMELISSILGLIQPKPDGA